MFVFIFKDGSVFIVFGEDINKAGDREREVSNEGQGNNNRESDQELKGVQSSRAMKVGYVCGWRWDVKGALFCFTEKIDQGLFHTL